MSSPALNNLTFVISDAKEESLMESNQLKVQRRSLIGT